MLRWPKHRVRGTLSRGGLDHCSPDGRRRSDVLATSRKRPLEDLPGRTPRAGRAEAIPNAFGPELKNRGLTPMDVHLGEQTLDEMCLVIPQLLVKAP